MRNARRSFLLLVGDDGAILFPPLHHAHASTLYVDGRKTKEVKDILDRIARHPTIPVLILADTQAQDYRQETLPPLSFLDRRKLLARRLEQAFPKLRLKSFLTQNENKTLLVSVEDKGAIGFWLDKLSRLPNPSGPVSLLPIECADMLATLSPDSRGGWGLLLCWHATGGFRQIVTYKGELIFTRLTPPLPATASSDYLAASLAVDIQATRDYLARFGLEANAPFHLAAIMPKAMLLTLNATPMEITSRALYTPFDAATKLGLPLGPRADETMADAVASQWVATRSKLKKILIKPAAQIELFHKKVYQIGKGVSIAVCALALLLTCAQSIDLLRGAKEGTRLQSESAALEKQIQETKAEWEESAKPLQRLRQAAERQRLFTSPPAPWQEWMEPIARALGEEARVTSLTWNKAGLTLDVRLAGADLPPDAPDTEKQEIIRRAYDLERMLRTALPTLSVGLTREPFSDMDNKILSNKDQAALKPLAPTASFFLRAEGL